MWSFRCAFSTNASSLCALAPLQRKILVVDLARLQPSRAVFLTTIRAQVATLASRWWAIRALVTCIKGDIQLGQLRQLPKLKWSVHPFRRQLNLTRKAWWSSRLRGLPWSRLSHLTGLLLNSNLRSSDTRSARSLQMKILLAILTHTCRPRISC